MIIGRKSKYIQELFTDLHTLCNQKRLAVIPDKLISTSLRSTHFSLVCFVLFCFCFVFFFPLTQVAKSRLGSFLAIFYITKFTRAYMCMRIVVVSPSG